MSMVCFFSGGREHRDPTILVNARAACPWSDQITSVVVGDEPNGFDRLVAAWCEAERIPYRVFRADWKTHGKKAGPLRNREAAKIAEACIAVPGAGTGTYSAIREAVRLGLPVFVYEAPGG
jgi:hypothetical protein